MTNCKGQNIVEYVLLVAAVALVCIFFFVTQSGGPMRQGVNATLNSIVNQIDHLNQDIVLPAQ